MVSVEAVEFAYRLILGREPESDAVVEAIARSCRDLAEVRTKFFSSEEFRAGRAAVSKSAPREPLTAPKSQYWAPIQVEVSVPDDKLSAMVRHVEATWERLGRLEPHWSVLTHEKFRAATIGENLEAFYASGEGIGVNAMRASAARYGIQLDEFGECFELGCGVGRVTRWLALTFPRVLACDISAPHLELCREAMERYSCSNVELFKLGTLAELETMREFDAFFSVIVLQHNPPPVIGYMLRAILSKLRPGGLGYFQVPSYSLGYEFTSDYLKHLDSDSGMEMHVFPQNALFALIEQSGCQLLEVREDDLGGTATMISNSILLRKRSGP